MSSALSAAAEVRHPGAPKRLARAAHHCAKRLECVVNLAADSAFADLVEPILPAHVVVAMHADLESGASPDSRITSEMPARSAAPAADVPDSTVRSPYIATARVRRIFFRNPGFLSTRTIARPELSGPIAIKERRGHAEVGQRAHQARHALAEPLMRIDVNLERHIHRVTVDLKSR